MWDTDWFLVERTGMLECGIRMCCGMLGFLKDGMGGYGLVSWDVITDVGWIKGRMRYTKF